MRFVCKNDKTHNRFESYGGTTTLMGWTRMYDAEGRPLNADPNTHREAYRCTACNTVYQKVTKGWDVEFISDDGHEVFLKQDNTPDYLKGGTDGEL